jgi:hypothetical protein
MALLEIPHRMVEVRQAHDHVVDRVGHVWNIAETVLDSLR